MQRRNGTQCILHPPHRPGNCRDKTRGPVIVLHNPGSNPCDSCSKDNHDQRPMRDHTQPRVHGSNHSYVKPTNGRTVQDADGRATYGVPETGNRGGGAVSHHAAPRVRAARVWRTSSAFVNAISSNLSVVPVMVLPSLPKMRHRSMLMDT